MRLFVPADSAAASVGSNETAEAIARIISDRGLDATLVRNGSRGMFWLEPLVEVETPDGRIAFGPVSAGDAAGVMDAIIGELPIPCSSARPRRSLI